MSSRIPVRLTNEQIIEILNTIPSIPGAGKTARSYLKNDVINKLSDILVNIKLVPVAEAFQEFKEEIIESFVRSLIEPGRPVGVTAGVSIGAPVTQLTLNSFHFAGSKSGVANAFEKIKGLITGTKTIKELQTTIFFKVPKNDPDIHTVLHKCSIDDILDRKSVYEQTSVFDLALDTEIIYRNDALQEGLMEMLEIQSILRPSIKIDLVRRQKFTALMRIKLDLYRMYTHRITMKMVAEAIEGPQDTPDAVLCLWKSLNHGYMYVTVDESLPYGKNLKTKTELLDEVGGITVFLQKKVKEVFKEMIVKGIPGILYLEPKTINVINGIYKIIRGPQSYQVYTNNFRTRWIGISLADLKNLFERAGFIVAEITDVNKENLYIDIIGGNGIEQSNTILNIEKLLKKKIDEANTAIEKRQIPISLDGKQPIIEKDANDLLIEAATFNCAEARGTNMKELVWVDEIDVYRTINNNPHETADLNGVDAARIYLIFKFREVLQNFSSAINGRHIALIFDMLTNMGYVNNLTFSGINRRKIGALALASNERAADVFVKAATFGSKEAMDTVSPSVFIGKQPNNIGTGLVHILEDDVEQEEFLISMPMQTAIEGGEEIVTGDIISGSKYENMFELAANERDMIKEANKVDKPLEAPLAGIGTGIGTGEKKSIFSFEELQNLTISSIRPSPNLISAIEKNVTEGNYIIPATEKKCVPTTNEFVPPTSMIALTQESIVGPKITNISPPKIMMPIVTHIPRKPGIIITPVTTTVVELPQIANITKPVQKLEASGLAHYLSLIPTTTEIVSAMPVRKMVEPISFATYTQDLAKMSAKK